MYVFDMGNKQIWVNQLVSYAKWIQPMGQIQTIGNPVGRMDGWLIGCLVHGSNPEKYNWLVAHSNIWLILQKKATKQVHSILSKIGVNPIQWSLHLKLMGVIFSVFSVS